MPVSDYFPAVRHLADYEIWCNARLFEAAAALTAEQLFQQFPFGLGTIHKTLFHTVSVFGAWSACIGPQINKPEFMDYDEKFSLAMLARLNAELAAAFLQKIEASHEADLLSKERRIQQVFHLITHGTHHRTQVITMLRLLGKEPPFEAGDFGGWSNGR